MFIPRFTIRNILAVMTLCALLFVTIGIAYRGQMWAWGVTIGILSLALTALVHAACFGLVWCFAKLSPEKTPASHGQSSPSVREDAS